MADFKVCPYTGAEVPITYLPYGGDGPLPSNSTRFSGSYKDYLRTCIRARVAAEHFRQDGWDEKPVILFPEVYPNSIDPVRVLKVPVLTQEYLKEWFIRLASSAGNAISNDMDLERYLSRLETELLRSSRNMIRNKPSELISRSSVFSNDYYCFWELRINDSSQSIGSGMLTNLIRKLCRMFPYEYIPWIELDYDDRIVRAAVYGQPGFGSISTNGTALRKELDGNNDSESLAARANARYAAYRDRKIAGMKRTIKKYGAPKPWIGYPLPK